MTQGDPGGPGRREKNPGRPRKTQEASGGADGLHKPAEALSWKLMSLQLLSLKIKLSSACTKTDFGQGLDLADPADPAAVRWTPILHSSCCRWSIASGSTPSGS